MTQEIPLHYFIVVCTNWPAVLAMFPDGLPWSAFTIDPIVSEDGMTAASPLYTYTTVDPASRTVGLPIVYYPDTAEGLAAAKAAHPTLPWSDFPRFAR